MKKYHIEKIEFMDNYKEKRIKDQLPNQSNRENYWYNNI